MAHEQLSRRGFLKLGGVAAGAGALASLAGCAPKAPETTTESLDNLQQARTYWLGEEPTVDEASIAAEETCEMLIIGAGNAGMMAAGTAADLGVDFIVAEKGNEVCDTREYLSAIDSKYALEAGAEPCPRRDRCRTLPMWSRLDSLISGYLDGITLADLLGETL